MRTPNLPDLRPNLTSGAQVMQTDEGIWHLEIPPGPKGHYRLAQLDDYSTLPRRAFPWRPPETGGALTMSLRARASARNLPGTWGFGLWNDPFNLSLGLGGASRRFPALPNTAWFFFASPPNYLSFRDDLPAQGALAATFQSPSLPVPALVAASPLLTFFFWSPTARLLRRLARRLIHQDAAVLSHDPTDWHTYSLEWRKTGVLFRVDEATVFETPTTPNGPLSLVLWIDNQYAALPPRGRLAFGFLPNPEPAWIEIDHLVMSAKTLIENDAVRY
jgi:hypothetical protein